MNSFFQVNSPHMDKVLIENQKKLRGLQYKKFVSVHGKNHSLVKTTSKQEDNLHPNQAVFIQKEFRQTYLILHEILSMTNCGHQTR